MLSTALGKAKVFCITLVTASLAQNTAHLSNLNTNVGLKYEFLKQRQQQKVHPTYSFCTISSRTDEGMYKLLRLTQRIWRNLHTKHVAKRFFIQFISEIKEDNINHLADTIKIRTGLVYSFPKLTGTLSSSFQWEIFPPNHVIPHAWLDKKPMASQNTTGYQFILFYCTSTPDNFSQEVGRSINCRASNILQNLIEQHLVSTLL